MFIFLLQKDGFPRILVALGWLYDVYMHCSRQIFLQVLWLTHNATKFFIAVDKARCSLFSYGNTVLMISPWWREYTMTICLTYNLRPIVYFCVFFCWVLLWNVAAELSWHDLVRIMSIRSNFCTLRLLVHGNSPSLLRQWFHLWPILVRWASQRVRQSRLA